MHQLQRMGLFGITLLLLLGFWAGLWYQGQRKGSTRFLAANGEALSARSAQDLAADEQGSARAWETSGGQDGQDGLDMRDGRDGQSAQNTRDARNEKSAADVRRARDERAGQIVQNAQGERGEADGTGETKPGNAEMAASAGRSGKSGAPAAEARTGQNAREGLAVHVVGGVASPGLYFLPPGSRIYDAVMEAEPEEDADIGRINMAMPIEDGMQIRIPLIGKPSAWDGEALVVRAEDRQAHVRTGDGAEAAGPEKIDINKASAAELETLPGIGPAFAQRIISYREQNGDFRSIDDLMKVRGIGSAKMDELRDRICCF